jgi:hypothetical protein
MPNEISATTTLRVTIGQAIYLTTLLIVLITGWLDVRSQVNELKREQSDTNSSLRDLAARVGVIERAVK